MNGLPTPPTILARQLFQPIDIWLLLQMMGVVSADLPVPPEMTSASNDLVAARATLLEQGIIQADRQGKLSVNPAIYALIHPSAYPDTLFVATITDAEPFGTFARTLCFSCVPARVVVNWVDQQNIHHFEAYDVQEIKACIVSHLWQVCNRTFQASEPSSASLPAQEVERMAQKMEQSVLLMGVQHLSQPEQTTQAISWFVSENHAVWMEKDQQGTPSAPRLVGQAEMMRMIHEFVEQIVSPL